MTGPITWRTVNGPSLSEASRPLEAAQRSIDNAFTGIGGLVKQAEATDAANWNQIKENNTQNFLNTLYAAQGAEGFKALQDSGELERMLAANGAQIDRAAARSAMDGRLSTLQQRDKQAGEFSDWSTTRAQRPIVNSIMTDIYSGNTDKAAATLASNPDLLNSPEIQKTLTDYKRKLVEQGRDDTRWTWNQDEQKWKVAAEKQKELLRPFEVKKAQSELDTAAAQRGMYGAQANAANEQVLASQARRERDEAEAEKARDLKKLGAALDGNIYKEGVYKDADTVELAKLMKDAGVAGTGGDAGDKRTKIIDRINTLAKTGIEIVGPDGKPVTVPLPLGAVKASILGSQNTLFSWNEGYADTFEKNLKERMQAVYNKPGPDGKPMAANKAADDYQNFLAIMRGTAEIAPAPSNKRK